jgi:hypothetical protein
MEVEARESGPKDCEEVFVYLCDGTTVLVSPANGVVLTQEQIVLYDGKRLMASFSRGEVLFCSKTAAMPFFC